MASPQNKTKSPKKAPNSVKNGKKTKLLSTQRYLSFSGAHDDTLVLKNGGLRAVLSVSAINIHLKSEDEQNAIIYSFQNFLNALEFPVQILVQSRKLDIDVYLKGLRDKIKDQPNELLRGQMEEHIQYVSKLVEFADIMDKKFYIVIPHTPMRSEKKSLWGKFIAKINPDESTKDVLLRKQEFASLKKTLDERVNVVQTGLENIGLSTRRLSTEKIIQLFYQTYNPDQARIQRLNHLEEIMGGEIPEDQLVVQ